MLLKVVIIFESVDKIIKCDSSNESYLAVISSMVLSIALFKVILTFESVDKNYTVSPFKRKLLSHKRQRHEMYAKLGL